MFMSTILSFPATKICQVRTKRKPLNIVNFLSRNETNFSKKECLDLFFIQNLRFGFKKKNMSIVFYNFIQPIGCGIKL